MEYYDRELIIDKNVSEALAVYFLLGLEPGSFGRALILNDKNMAYRHAHRLLYTDDRDIVPDHLRLVTDFMPEECWGTVRKYEDWVAHQGLKYADPAVKVKLMLQLGRNYWPFHEAKFTRAMDYLWGCEREVS
jgi:hypothetical protein